MARTRQIKPETLFFPKKLMERLASIKAFPLTLVEAPSGFGKTTALRHFCDTQVSETAQVIWRTFSPESPNTSWKSFCACISAFDEDAAERLNAAGAPSEDSLSEIREIFGQIACTEETYLVLDDFAAWKLPNAGVFLSALSEHSGKGLHVVVASLVLSKETRNHLLPSIRFLLLQEAVLTFAAEDIEAYYREAGVSLTAVQLEELQQITGGWIMVLYLQLLSIIETGQFERGGMQDLIHNALWNRLPESEREFLLAVSIFPRFSLTQATALFGRSAVETEQLLREKRVFVHFDRDARRFYLHALFQNFLAEQFEMLPETKQKESYLAGGKLAEQAGDRVNTLRFYYLSGEWERLLALPLTSYEIADVVDDFTKPMILDIMENTPFETKRKYPTAMVPLAFTLFFLHESQKLLGFREEIRQVIEQSELSQIQKNALSGEMELLYSFLTYNRIDAMSVGHRKALELLGGPATLINLQSTWTFGSPSVLYLFWRESGKLDEELGQMDECMPIYYTLTKGHGSGAEIIMRAEAHFLRGEIDQAEILCHKAMFTADSRRQNSIYQCGLFLLARIALLRGDETMLQSALHSMEERSRQNIEDLCRYTLDLVKGFIFMLLGRGNEVSPWLAAGEINDKRLVIMTQPFAHIIYGRLLLERGEYQKLLGVSEFGLGLSTIFPNLLPQLYIKLYQAQAFLALGNRPQAIEALQSALDIALPDGMLLPLAENYDGIKKLLSDTACAESALEKITTLHQGLTQGLASFRRKELTPREKEILGLLKMSLTNKEIAERLHLSPNTIRNVISGMLEKCGFASREQLKTLPDGK
ncbi:LuxR C-terminal-related transcriptional regulator [Desulforamulus aeronauticus]|uniref:LuxR family transcriptional regulator, maltose regulon positive regulatory protein n=1 Tax=Desulforamulus aeronauticus DSM 10349 TaxID=1121421 RepID=A0A1M6P1U1_9FIRM|nr:LuxR C-terminal-related transcriptional regulator [Desulforamulus aeronauticus]SHK01853.1 LuxR family transcriptional regulator, maltose regulon positive regulatory protein [Desulforamulus aeronauticus DSM 10349]